MANLQEIEHELDKLENKLKDLARETEKADEKLKEKQKEHLKAEEKAREAQVEVQSALSVVADLAQKKSELTREFEKKNAEKAKLPPESKN